MTILFPEGFMFVLFWVLYHGYKKFANRDSVILREPSLYRNQETNRLNVKPILLTIFRGVIAVMIPANISLMTYICREWVGVSPAVIQSFTSMSAFTTAVLFYILY